MKNETKNPLLTLSDAQILQLVHTVLNPPAPLRPISSGHHARGGTSAAAMQRSPTLSAMRGRADSGADRNKKGDLVRPQSSRGSLSLMTNAKVGAEMLAMPLCPPSPAQIHLGGIGNLTSLREKLAQSSQRASSKLLRGTLGVGEQLHVIEDDPRSGLPSKASSPRRN